MLSSVQWMVLVTHKSQTSKFVALITSTKEVFVVLVCLSVWLSFCLSVCSQHYSKGYEQITMKVYGFVCSG